MGLLQTLFNTGLREIEAQADVLEAKSTELMTALSTAEKDIDQHMEQLVLIREARSIVDGNLIWLRLELTYSNNLLNFTETAELYERYDYNEEVMRVLDSMKVDHTPIARNGIREVAGGFQAVLEAYHDEIDKLGKLIDEHGSDSNIEQLKEVLAKYGVIYDSQVERFNTYVESYGFDQITVR